MNKPYIIGITGSAGKTTCSYILQQYFKYLDYSCDIITSNYIDINNRIIEKRNHLSAEELQYYLRQASNTDYLIIEINEDSLKNDNYVKINFDCKILVNFYKDFSLHRGLEEYMLLKTDFINSQNCLKIINKSSDNYNNLNIENAIVFNTSNDSDAIISLIQDNYKFKNSNCVIRVNDENFTLSLGYNSSLYKSIVTIIATLYGMDIWDADSFINDFLPNIQIPGRYDLKEYNGRNVIVDSGNGKSLKQFMEETTDISNYSVKGLVTMAGGLSDDIFNDMSSKGFKSLNKYLVADPIVRKHCFVFGGTLYKIYHKIDKFRDDVVFQEVIDTLGSDVWLEGSTIPLDIPDSIVEGMIAITSMLGDDELTKSYKYCKNFWWRSIPVIKGYFTIHYDDFMFLYNNFINLNNPLLTQSCEYVKEMIEYEISAFSKLGKSLEDLPLEKIYITVNTDSTWNNELELEMYKAFFKQPVEIFTNRQEAIKQMALESKENDILFLAGRGDQEEYIDKQGPKNFKDLDYIKLMLVKEEE